MNARQGNSYPGRFSMFTNSHKATPLIPVALTPVGWPEKWPPAFHFNPEDGIVLPANIN